MAEAIELEDREFIDLKKHLEKIGLKVNYGSIKIHFRDGKIYLATIERTVRLD